MALDFGRGVIIFGEGVLCCFLIVSFLFNFNTVKLEKRLPSNSGLPILLSQVSAEAWADLAVN